MKALSRSALREANEVYSGCSRLRLQVATVNTVLLIGSREKRMAIADRMVTSTLVFHSRVRNPLLRSHAITLTVGIAILKSDNTRYFLEFELPL